MNKDYSNERTPTPSERVVETTMHHLELASRKAKKPNKLWATPSPIKAKDRKDYKVAKCCCPENKTNEGRSGRTALSVKTPPVPNSAIMVDTRHTQLMSGLLAPFSAFIAGH